MKRGPWTRSTEGVHGPGVHVLYFPDMFHKGIQYALEKLGKSKFGFESTTVSSFKSKRHDCSGNEFVDYSRAPCLGADQKACGLWERDCFALFFRVTHDRLSERGTTRLSLAL